ncbi:MAG: S-layer homology domain-containing protein [Clostridia bacterium]|nr:S-layer homology domain-containing protein [Clostridia bacterium]
MMNSKKISAVLLCIVMMISMLSCFVLGTSADMGSGLGYAVTIEEGNFVGGTSLPSNVIIVNDDWFGKTGKVALKLDGKVYSAWLGAQAFGSLADATKATVVQSGNTAISTAGKVIYVAPGTYTGGVEVYGNDTRIYGPMAGVNPNNADLITANAKRPAAAGGDAVDLSAEAVIVGRITLMDNGLKTTIEGFYFSGNSLIYQQQGYKHRTGIFVKNNIFDVTSENILHLTSSSSATVYAGDVEFMNNRVLNGRHLLEMWFTMDVTVQNNYINLSETAIISKTVESNSIGDNILLDRNYFPQTVGLYSFSESATYDTLMQGVTISNNVVDDCSAAASGLVYYRYLGDKNLPGTMISIIGNTFKKLSTSAVPFQFAYLKNWNQPVIFRYLININENYLDVTPGATLVSAGTGVKGVLNMGYNYYPNGIEKSQIDLQDGELELVLNPQYADETMTAVKEGGCKVVDVNGLNAEKVTIDDDQNLVILDLTGDGVDYLELANMLVVSPNCTWRLYEDATLNTPLKDKVMYLDGSQTDRYALIENEDGTGVVYRIHVRREAGNEAKLLKLTFSGNIFDVDEAVNGRTFAYTFNAEDAFVNYSIKTSAGASYALYADAACKQPLDDLGSYIPYGNNYVFYVKINSEDKTVQDQVYTVRFNRDAGSFDPAILNMTADAAGTSYIQNDIKFLVYELDSLAKEATIKLTATLNASYQILDKSGATVLSSNTDVKALTLTDGINEFTVKVTDKYGRSNTFTLAVENGKLSSDNAITGIEGVSTTIVDNTISFVGSGDSTNVTFKTRNEYAVCEVYADAEKTIKMTYTSNIIPVNGRDTDARAFTLPTAVSESHYYVVCIAENGSKRDYELIITKNAISRDYIDVQDPNAWFYDYVQQANDQGLLIGENIGTNQWQFRPDDAISRQEVAMVIVRLMGVNAANYTSTKLPYADSNAIAPWAADAVKTCFSRGYMKGSDDGELYFNPESSITRQEVMVLFARAFNLTGTADLSAFKDAASVAPWANAEVQAVIASGLIEGNKDGTLAPDAGITRAEMAAICTRTAALK